jgi:hypothetical protein
MRRKRTLLPGKLMLVVGLLGMAVGYGGAVLIVLHLGAAHEGVGARLGAEIPVAMGWVLYKAASQRVVLDEDEMRIYTWGLCWRVPRGWVREVDLRLRDLLTVVVVLTDGYRIRPTTFAAGEGIGRGNPRFMGRSEIRDTITTWNAGASTPPVAIRGSRGRYWRIRTDDLPVLAAMALIILALATIS